MDAADVNDDGQLDVSDAVYWLIWRFSGKLDLLQPYPYCGEDASVDSLGCDRFDSCAR